jgi:putative transposase
MAKRQIYAKLVYHVYNRAVLKQALFRREADYRFFIDKIEQYKNNHRVDVITFCIMPNHFHMLIYAREESVDISRFMKSLQHSYAFYFKRNYGSEGHVFESRYKHKLVKDPIYLSNIIAYIKNNPVRKGLVDSADKWRFTR